MATTESKITSKGQLSVPAIVRRALNLTPGSRIEWQVQDGEVMVRRVAHHSSEDIHAAVFEKSTRPASLDDMDAGIRSRMTKKHARD